MKINQILTKTDYNTVVAGANVTISHRDALFLYHAFNQLSISVTNVGDMMPQITDDKGLNRDVEKIQGICNSLHELLMPIASEIVLPKESIDIYTYVSDTNEVEAVGKISLKKKPSYKYNDDVLATNA